MGLWTSAIRLMSHGPSRAHGEEVNRRPLTMRPATNHAPSFAKTRKLRILRKSVYLTLKKGCMDMADTVPASEFTRNFGRYRMLAQRNAVAVSSHGSITGYFVAPDEYEEFQRFKQQRRSFATAELSDDKVRAIGASRMDKRHAHLDAMLDPK
jgi:hypothetical protein